MESSEKILSDIRERVVRVETKIDLMTNVEDTAKEAKEIAVKALESTKSAHRRLDKVDKLIFWVGTTVIGAVLLALITSLWVSNQ